MENSFESVVNLLESYRGRDRVVSVYCALLNKSFLCDARAIIMIIIGACYSECTVKVECTVKAEHCDPVIRLIIN